MNEPTLETLTLLEGSHDSREEGMCVVEAAAWLAGEPHSDEPACVCPVLSAVAIGLNDVIDDDERRTQLLLPLVPMLVGTRADDETQHRRSLEWLDWMVREWLPAWLDLVPSRKTYAQQLRDSAPVTDETAAEIGEVVRAADADADADGADMAAARAGTMDAWVSAWTAARKASGAATWESAGDAARCAACFDALSSSDAAASAAAWGAARYAARCAAWVEAWAAARDFAGDAVWDEAKGVVGIAARSAARTVLRPTVMALQESAVELLMRQASRSRVDRRGADV